MEKIHHGLEKPLGESEVILHVVNRLSECYSDDVGLLKLLVDFKNAFNLVDRYVMLREVRLYCSAVSRVFPPSGVKLLGGPAIVDFHFCNDLVMKRVTKTIVLMDAVAKINEHQCELLLLCSCTGISRLYFTMLTCPPHFFEYSQHSFDVALCYSLERIFTASGPGFDDWQWRLATLPFAFGGLMSIQQAMF
nr:hypothetical protein [Tanacetum cinerariifolium]